jgi:pimeloyl-ACP methyl ester carboxylesterase
VATILRNLAHPAPLPEAPHPPRRRRPPKLSVVPPAAALLAATLLAAATLGAGGLAAPAAAAPPGAPAKLVLAPCQLPGVAGAARCGSLEVWEDRAARAGRKISLRVAVLPARSARPAPDPLFIVVGGPGQGAATLAAPLAKIFEQVQGDRDVVLVDQRGTGASHPLNCKLPGSDDDPQSYFGDMLPAGAIRACRARLDADPALYTTPVAMDDLDEVRAALGYDKINLYGSSYGSRGVLVYMRQHPEHVRSATLRLVVPTNMRTPLYYARDAQRALILLFAACKADPACHRAYPDLERQWQVVEDRLAEAPGEAEVAVPGGDGRHVRVRLSRDEFNEAIRYRLYSEESNQIPRFIARAHAGDYSEVAQLALRQRRAAARGDLLSVGVYLSVMCSEDNPFIDLALARRLAAGTFLGTYRVDQQAGACAVWPRGKLPADYLDDVRSSAPTLLISGVRDPVAPPAFGEQVARHLTQVTHLVLPQGFHGLPDPCTIRLMNAFVIQGSPRGLDTSCVQQVRAPPFLMPGDPPPGGERHAAAAPPAAGGPAPPAVSPPAAAAVTPAPPAVAPTAPATPATPAAPAGAEAADPTAAAAEGLWAGTLIYKPAEQEAEVTVELARDPQGRWVGTIDVPNQNMKFFPLANVHAAGGSVSWQFDRFSDKAGILVQTPFTGKLSADGGTISGDFFEGGRNHVPLVLRRIGEAGSPREEPRLAPVTLLSESGEELRAAFNRDAGKVRLLMLLSPT